MAYANTNLLSYISTGQKSGMDLTKPKSMCWQSVFISAGLGKNLYPGLSDRLHDSVAIVVVLRYLCSHRLYHEDSSQFLEPFFHSQNQQWWVKIFSCCIFLTHSLAFLLNDSCDYTGSILMI